ncbi:MAG: hypothetical protein IKR18_03450 [Bacteroidaceae bacterium]|nr:hypothetical protein [Bacteroidaceae bacterium]
MNAENVNFHWLHDMCDNGALLTFYWYGEEKTMLHFDSIPNDVQNSMQNYINGYIDAQGNHDSDKLINAVRHKFKLKCEEVMD